ncbi:unnamed protein product [Rhodiola kirilowii]
MALGIKMKLGFVHGAFPRPTDPYQGARWDKCNNVVLSWIINSVSPEIGSSLIHSSDCMNAWEDLEERFAGSKDFTIFSIQQEIASLMQEDKSIAQYYNKFVQLWGDEDALTVEVACELGSRCQARKCSNDRKMRDKRMKFLMGLNEVYTTSRSNILQMKPSPNLKECYKQLVQDESQRKSKRSTLPEMSALYVGQSHTSQSNGDSQQSQFSGGNMQSGRPVSGVNRKSLFCSFCKLQGHLRETCYKLHGYPPGYKFTNNKSTNFNPRGNRSVANAVVSEGSNAGNDSKDNSSTTEAAPIQISSLKMTQDQLNKLMQFLGDHGTQNSDHMTGICLSSVKVDKDTWVIDSGATDHITPHAHLLTDLASLSTLYSVLMPNGKRVMVTHTGTCVLSNTITLSSVLLVPHIRYNLIYVAKLVEGSNLSVQFTEAGCCIQDLVSQTLQGTGELIEGLYHFKSVLHGGCLSVTKEAQTAALWHYRLGHVPYNKLSSTLKHCVPDFSCNQSNMLCHICPQAKQTRLPFPVSTTSTQHMFELIHVDIWGPYKEPTITGAKYFLTIVEDKSRVTWTYLMKQKSEAADYLISFYLMIQTQFNCSIKTVRTDNSAEFLSHKVINFLQTQGCVQQTSCTYSPQQNGVVKRKHRHLLEVARSLKFQAQVPDLLWGDCVLTATYIINRLPSSVLKGITPFEVLFKRKPEYAHMRAFGCLCYMTKIAPGKSKFDTRAIPCIFTGYAFDQKGYKLFDLQNHVSYVSRDVKFVESIFPCAASEKQKSVPCAASEDIPET